MADGAFGGGVLEDIIDMAFFAGYVGVPAAQLEGRKVMVKSGRLPTVGGMTGAAILPKFAVMLIIFLMTRKTSDGCTLENSVSVAFFASHSDMLSIQLEDR